jgi:hypothetical protein
VILNPEDARTSYRPAFSVEARSMKKIFTLATLLSMIAAIAAATGMQATSLATSALAPFDQAHPGRGLDAYHKEPADHAMAYALFALATAEMRDAERAKVAADWLVAHSRQSKGVGWGLDFSYDAFNDGSKNPADTIYGITTGLAVRALLDVHAIAPNEGYIRTAQAALEGYASLFIPSEHGGYFPYSFEPGDRKDVHNVNAILAAQYARLGQMQDNVAFREIGEKLARHIWAHRVEGQGEVWWPYGENSKRPNDAVHAAYIVDGLRDVARLEVDLAPAVRHLASFIRNGAIYDHPAVPNVTERALKVPARLWGVGMLLFVLADAGDQQSVQAILKSLPSYQIEPGVYATSLADRRFMPRHQGHLLWGLARLER